MPPNPRKAVGWLLMHKAYMMRASELASEKQSKNKRRAPSLRARADLVVKGWCMQVVKGNEGYYSWLRSLG